MDKEVQNKVRDRFRNFPSRKYGKGQILIYAGDPIEHIYYLKTGLVRQYDITYRGDEIVLNQFRSGAFFPMSNVVNSVESRFFYRAEVDVELSVVPPEVAIEFIKDNPDVLYELLSRVYRGTDVLLGRLSQLMGGNAKSKIVFELLNELKRHPSGDESVELKIKEHDIAARAGLSRETVSRELKNLKKTGVVSVAHSGISVLDRAKLSELGDN